LAQVFRLRFQPWVIFVRQRYSSGTYSACHGDLTTMTSFTIKAILLGFGAFGAAGCQGLGGKNHAQANAPADPCAPAPQHEEHQGFLARFFGKHHKNNDSNGVTAAMPRRGAPNVPLAPGETLVSYGETTMPVVEATSPSICPSVLPSAPCAIQPSVSMPSMAPGAPPTVAPPPALMPTPPRTEPQAQPVPARPTSRQMPQVN